MFKPFSKRQHKTCKKRNKRPRFLTLETLESREMMAADLPTALLDPISHTPGLASEQVQVAFEETNGRTRRTGSGLLFTDHLARPQGPAADIQKRRSARRNRIVRTCNAPGNDIGGVRGGLIPHV